MYAGIKTMAGVNGFDEAIETMEECIQDVAKEIGRDWKKLGRKLKVKECVIEGIEEEYKPTEERAYQVLKKWLQVNGTHGATIHVLYEALIAIDKTYIAEKLIGKCSLISFVLWYMLTCSGFNPVIQTSGLLCVYFLIQDIQEYLCTMYKKLIAMQI